MTASPHAASPGVCTYVLHSGFGFHSCPCGVASTTCLVSAVGICPSPCPRHDHTMHNTLSTGAYKAPATRVLLVGGGWSCLGRAGSGAYKAWSLSEGAIDIGRRRSMVLVGDGGLRTYSGNLHATCVPPLLVSSGTSTSGRSTSAADSSEYQLQKALHFLQDVTVPEREQDVPCDKAAPYR
jgi:hypothetical protein